MWNINFISREDFKSHVANTIKTYDATLKSIGLAKFNSNIVDPIKLTFDSKVYRKDIEQIIRDEIGRQRDKTNTNAIGYFHQNMFKYLKRCEVPIAGFDVIYTRPDNTKIYVEMKNKHNTMNSAASGKTMIKMQHQIIDDDDSVCFLVEAIAQKSQNIKWEVTVDKKKISNKRIRRVSMDKFYSLITGDKYAFYKICNALPVMIKEIMETQEEYKPFNDTVISELRKMSENLGINTEELAIQTAIYMLGFGNYDGFEGK